MDSSVKSYCQIISFLIKEKLITVSETKWKLSIDDCYAKIVERINPTPESKDPIPQSKDPTPESNVEYVDIIPKDPPKTPKILPPERPSRLPVAQ